MRPNRYPYSGANIRAMVLETRNYGTGEIMHKELETPLKHILRILNLKKYRETNYDQTGSY